MKWGIIGTGAIANKFATTLSKMHDEGEELVAVASRNVETARAFADQYGVKNAYGPYEAMMADPQVEAVYIATPNTLHYENAKICLESGKHVLCEKPFTINAGLSKQLYALAREKGLFIMEAFWIRFLPVLREMQKVIAAGEIGKVTHVRCDYGFIPASGKTERKLTNKLAMGALMDIGIYNLGFVHMVMDAAPVNFSSVMRKNAYDTDEFNAILLEYPDERSASVSTAIGMDIPRDAAVFGKGGYIRLPDYQVAQKMTIHHNDGTVREVNIPFDINGFEYEIRESSRCVKLGLNTSDVLSERDSLTVLETMDKIRESWGLVFPGEE